MTNNTVEAIAEKLNQEVEAMSPEDIKSYFDTEKQTIFKPLKVNQEIIAILLKYELVPDFTTIDYEADVYYTDYLKTVLIDDRENYGIEDELSEEAIKEILLFSKYADMIILPVK